MFNAEVAILSSYLTCDESCVHMLIMLFDRTWNSASASTLKVAHVRPFPTVVLVECSIHVLYCKRYLV
jgi:hypothetical protein